MVFWNCQSYVVSTTVLLSYLRMVSPIPNIGLKNVLLGVKMLLLEGEEEEKEKEKNLRVGEEGGIIGGVW